MVLDVSLLNIQHYKVRIKGKVEQSMERSSAFPNRKGSLQVTLDNGRQFYLLSIYEEDCRIERTKEFKVYDNSWNCSQLFKYLN